MTDSLYSNPLYIELYKNCELKTHQMNEFVEFHKHFTHTKKGMAKVEYDPEQFEKFSEPMMAQHVMLCAIESGNLELVKHVYCKFGHECFEEFKTVPDYSLGNIFHFAIASNPKIVDFLVLIGCNICWNAYSEKNSKVAGVMTLERAIYSKNQDLVDLVTNELNREIIKHGLNEDHPVCFQAPCVSFDLKELEGKNVYKYLFHGELKDMK